MLEIINDIRSENGWTNFASFIKLGKQGMINQKPAAWETQKWARTDLINQVCNSFVNAVLDGKFKDTADNRMDFCFGITHKRMNGLAQTYNWVPFRGTLITMVNDKINKIFKNFIL